MDCDFDNPDHICHWCGVKGEPGLQKNCKKAPPITTPCVHRGAYLREHSVQTCEGCPGNVRFKVYVCALHGQCNPQVRLPGVKCCNSCGDYELSEV